jgi:DNA-binding NarL/FixJ family response regulator/two-component sensor histidine kinase
LLSIRAAAISAERVRIAREMGDTAGKSLLGISMLAAALASAGLSGEARSLDYRLRELGRLARRAVTEANGVINDLREDAVAAQLRGEAAAWSLASGTNVSVDLPRSTETTEQIRTQFCAILREALANVAQHAYATHVRVSLRVAGEQLQLAIEDNGTGFSLSATEEEFPVAATGGLARMRELAGRLDGVVLIRSSASAGTRIEVRIPGPGAASIRPSAPSRSRRVRVLIADRNPVLRLGLRVVLEQAVGVEVVAEVTTAGDLAELVAEHAPDVLLLDAAMALPGGMATIRQLGDLTSVVMVTSGPDPLAAEAVAAGARLCALHGEFDHGDLIRLVHDAASAELPRLRMMALAPGGSGPRSAELSDSAQPSLRPREREVMQLIAEGLSNRQIASRLVVSEKTVKNHISSIYSRLGVHGRGQALRSWTLSR